MMRIQIVAASFVGFALLASVPLANAQFTPGDVFVGQQLPANLFNITTGGNFVGAVPFAMTGTSLAGQLAWSPDLATMYSTVYGDDKVVAVTSSGLVSDFATGLSGPTGLILTSAGRLFVSEWASGEITDITAGGDFSGAATFASGLSGPRNLLEMLGTLFVAEQNTGEISDVTLGGVIGAANIYAHGFEHPTDLLANPLGFYVAEYVPGEVTRVTSPGDYSAVPPFASGQNFIGLTYSASGRLLASTLGGSAVYDITAGGDFSAAPAFAQFDSSLESTLDTVPVPEPAIGVLIGFAALAPCSLRRR